MTMPRRHYTVVGWCHAESGPVLFWTNSTSPAAAQFRAYELGCAGCEFGAVIRGWHSAEPATLLTHVML